MIISALRFPSPFPAFRIILEPRRTWDDAEAYDAQAAKLVEMFRKNFTQYESHVGEDVLAAAPKLK